MRKVALLATSLVLAASVAPVAADDRQDCVGTNAGRKISACTALIESKREAGPNLALAYRNRGLGHAINKDYDQAIADFSKAIELNPRSPSAYNDRAVAYTNKGDFQHAV